MSSLSLSSPVGRSPRKSKKQLAEEAAAAEQAKLIEQENARIAAAAAAEEEYRLSQLSLTLSLARRSAARLLRHPRDHPDAIHFNEAVEFIMTNDQAFPHSRGRMYLLEQAGPLSHRHYFSCLCPSCRDAIMNLRKSNDAARDLFAGLAFTRGNLKKTEGDDDEGQGQQGEEIKEQEILSRTLPSLASAPSPSAASSSPFSSTGPLSLSQLSAHLSAMSPPSDTAHLQPVKASRFGSRLLDGVLPFAPCPSCAAHIQSATHLLGGRCGALAMKAGQVKEAAEALEEKELLIAYKCPSTISLREGKEFIHKLGSDKKERAHRPITRIQVVKLLAKAKVYKGKDGEDHGQGQGQGQGDMDNTFSSTLLSDYSSPLPTALLDFDSVRSLIRSFRISERHALARMYPDVTSKGYKGPPDPYTSVHATYLLSDVPRMEYNLTKEYIAKSRSNGRRGPNGQARIGAKLPDYAASALNERLLHQLGHQVVELKEMKKPDLHLNAHLMRQMPSNAAMGWRTSTNINTR